MQMKKCRMNVVVKSRAKLFKLGYVECSLNIKKNKIKKVTHINWFPGREIQNKNQADLLIGKDIDQYLSFDEIVEIFGYKKSAASVNIKLQRSLGCVPRGLWINLGTSIFAGKSVFKNASHIPKIVDGKVVGYTKSSKPGKSVLRWDSPYYKQNANYGSSQFGGIGPKNSRR
jgi:hypothetical protein